MSDAKQQRASISNYFTMLVLVLKSSFVFSLGKFLEFIEFIVSFFLCFFFFFFLRKLVAQIKTLLADFTADTSTFYANWFFIGLKNVFKLTLVFSAQQCLN